MTINRMQNARIRNALLAVLIVIIGIFFRILAAQRGHNFDVDSYLIVANIVSNGGNVYQETSRYNYGPIWFHILYFIDLCHIDGIAWTSNFRLKIALFLTAVDLGIFLFLWRHYSLKIGAIFLLNPISIIITGYHSQFDNLAILLGFFAAYFYMRSDSRPAKIGSLVLLGLSLSTKHLLFLFPIWLAFKQKQKITALLVILIPYAIFITGFLPYLPEGAQGIIKNVLFYKSFNNAPFWAIFSPNVIYTFVPRTLLMILALLVVGFLVRRRTVLECLHIYLIALVVFSSAIANQYLAIPIASISVFWNWGYAAYSAIGLLYLAVAQDGLHLDFLREIFNWKGGYGYYILTFLLTVGFLMTFFGGNFDEKFRKTLRTIPDKV
jgi:hypothetical protein